MQAYQRLTPDPDANALAMQMLRNTDTLRAVLEETLASAQNGVLKESGRTVCPRLQDRIMGPLSRFPRSVSLEQCPRGQAGLIHTHVTPDELLTPEHSIPDMANTAFHNVSASIIVGTQTSDVLVAPRNKALMQQAFHDVLGHRVGSTREVIQTMRRGDINPVQTRRELRDELSGLFRTEDTAFPGLTAEVRRLFDNDSRIRASEEYGLIEYAEVGRASHPRTPHRNRSTNDTPLSRSCGHIRNQTERIAARQQDAVDAIRDSVDLRGIVLGSLISNLVTEIAVNPIVNAISPFK